MDTELKRRYDLVPNLVQVVKGYATHERGLFEAVAAERALAFEAGDHVAQRAAHERALGAAVARVVAVAEAYPELRAADQYLRLQEELAITEDRIQAARRFYNANVRDYRDLTRGFPGKVFAGVFGFEDEEFFETAPAWRAVPAVTGGA